MTFCANGLSATVLSAPTAILQDGAGEVDALSLLMSVKAPPVPVDIETK
jgi:hypothetical protein